MIIRALTLPGLVIALLAAPVAAQAGCGHHAAIVANLERVYGESRRGVGLAGPNTLFELWTDPKDGSWTIIRMNPGGWACVFAMGESWIDYGPVLPGAPL